MQLFSTCAFVINIIAKTDVSEITNNILWLQHYVRQLQKSVYHTRHHSITNKVYIMLQITTIYLLVYLMSICPFYWETKLACPYKNAEGQFSVYYNKLSTAV